MRTFFQNRRSTQGHKADLTVEQQEQPQPAPWQRSDVAYAYLGDGVGLALTHRGHKILVFTRDYGIAPHIIANGLWEPNIEKAIMRLIEPGATIVEVGCNVGYHTLAMAQAVGATGHVYGFEANPELFSLLRWSVDLNGLLPRTTLFNHAVTDAVGEVRFDFEPIAAGGGHVVTKDHREGPKAITVRSEPLDKTLDTLEAADLIRMDAEGSEPLIIAGAVKLLGRSPKLRIVTEWSPIMMRHHASVSEFIALLRSFAFLAWRIDHDAQFVTTPMDELEALPHCELVFSRDDLTPPPPAEPAQG
ncbi:FkbM family methyltransferase [Pseudorhodoplanes sp.]|uniref:FkbM family methyltransferase n=1 Tax=Pseudorhodoplanes sp. TaxID=1934341 RepID=UPI003D0DA592